MPPTIQQLGLDVFSDEDRLAIAEQLCDSVTQQVAIGDAERAELERRAADADSDGGIPWDVIRTESRGRWQDTAGTEPRSGGSR